MESPAELKSILLGHIVNGTYFLGAFMTSPDLRNLNGGLNRIFANGTSKYSRRLTHTVNILINDLKTLLQTSKWMNHGSTFERVWLLKTAPFTQSIAFYCPQLIQTAPSPYRFLWFVSTIIKILSRFYPICDCEFRREWRIFLDTCKRESSFLLFVISNTIYKLYL